MGPAPRRRWSKTIQYCNRTLLVPVPKIDHSKRCPHDAILSAFKLLGGYDFASLLSGAAFVYTYQVKPLTYNAVCNKIKQLLEQCGIDASQYSGHFFRRGGATFAMNSIFVVCPATTLSFKGIGFQMRMNAILTPYCSIK